MAINVVVNGFVTGDFMAHLQSQDSTDLFRREALSKPLEDLLFEYLLYFTGTSLSTHLTRLLGIGGLVRLVRVRPSIFCQLMSLVSKYFFSRLNSSTLVGSPLIVLFNKETTL